MNVRRITVRSRRTPKGEQSKTFHRLLRSICSNSCTGFMRERPLSFESVPLLFPFPCISTGLYAYSTFRYMTKNDTGKHEGQEMGRHWRPGAVTPCFPRNAERNPKREKKYFTLQEETAQSNASPDYYLSSTTDNFFARHAPLSDENIKLHFRWIWSELLLNDVDVFPIPDSCYSISVTSY